MAQLENGYSVSETDDDRTHINDPELISMRSGFTGVNKSPANGRSSEHYDAFSPFFPGVNHRHKYSGASEGVDVQIRGHEQQL